VQRHPVLEQGGQRRVAVTTKGICHPDLANQITGPGIDPISMGEHR
jgi:hypothetical protein